MLSLERFRELIEYSPYNFWQQTGAEVNNYADGCDPLVYEYAYHSADAAGRHDIREAIKQAHNLLFEHLGYRIGPEYIERVVPFPRAFNQGLSRCSLMNSRGRWIGIDAGEGYIQAMGQLGYTLLATPSVSYSDANSDGLTDTFTIAAATSVTDAGQIALYFAAADRPNSHLEQWRIEPIDVVIAGGTVTITGPSYLLVKPQVYRRDTPETINPNSTGPGDGLFAQTLEIYQRFTYQDGQTKDDAQAVLIWETDPPPFACAVSGLTFEGGYQDPAAAAYVVARAGVRDARRGIVYVGEAVRTEEGNWVAPERLSGWREPDRVLLRFLAGAPYTESTGQIVDGGNWEWVIARLAAAELNRAICGCLSAQITLNYWQEDMTLIEGPGNKYQTSFEQLNNPIGPRRGHLWAWNRIKQLAVKSGVLI
jgi:hypothetical protein